MLTRNTDHLQFDTPPDKTVLCSVLPAALSVDMIEGKPLLIQFVKESASRRGFVWTDPESDREFWAVGNAFTVKVNLSDRVVVVSRPSGSDDSRGRKSIRGFTDADMVSESYALDELFEECQTLDGSTSVRVVAELWDELSKRFTGESNQDQAIAYFGFSFDPKHPTEKVIWGGWPDAFLRVPELIYTHHRKSGEVSLLRIVADGMPSKHDLVAGETPPLTSPVSETASWTDLEQATAWSERVAAVVEGTTAGSIEKVVLARCREGRAPRGFRFDSEASLASLWASRDEATIFSVGCNGSVFLGVTPEHLVRVLDGRVSTHALAGTVKAEDGFSALTDEKLLREHEHVVDQMRDDLRCLLESVHWSERPRFKRAGAMIHLETEVTGRLTDGETLFSLVERLHPTPALGGSPRNGALAWLRSEEPMERGYYGAPIGWVSPNGDGVCAVAIRSALLSGDRAWAFAGAGIVSGSCPQAEWDETALKFASVMGSLELRSTAAHND